DKDAGTEISIGNARMHLAQGSYPPFESLLLLSFPCRRISLTSRNMQFSAGKDQFACQMHPQAVVLVERECLPDSDQQEQCQSDQGGLQELRLSTECRDDREQDRASTQCQDERCNRLDSEGELGDPAYSHCWYQGPCGVCHTSSPLLLACNALRVYNGRQTDHLHAERPERILQGSRIKARG